VTIFIKSGVLKMNDKADFYLASTEGSDMEEPRSCWRLKRIRTDNRDDLLLVKIDPPLVGQKHGLGGRDIDFVLLAPHTREVHFLRSTSGRFTSTLPAL
jgi:hypothetical protein